LTGELWLLEICGFIQEPRLIQELIHGSFSNSKNSAKKKNKVEVNTGRGGGHGGKQMKLRLDHGEI
jgi:hypothetical protein